MMVQRTAHRLPGKNFTGLVHSLEIFTGTASQASQPWQGSPPTEYVRVKITGTT
jgi:hypothetical protein